MWFAFDSGICHERKLALKNCVCVCGNPTKIGKLKVERGKEVCSLFRSKRGTATFVLLNKVCATFSSVLASTTMLKLELKKKLRCWLPNEVGVFVGCGST